MLFNSIAFFLFLPIAFVLYWFVFGKKLWWQNLFVVAISYFFYACWDWRFLGLIIFTSFSSWLGGFEIARNRAVGDDRGMRNAKIWLWLSLIVNFGILGFFKYYDFFVESFVALFAAMGISLHANTLNLILPVGISFYTLQSLSYCIDVYRGKLAALGFSNSVSISKNGFWSWIKDIKIVEYFAFVSFFPQLVAGPIERATNLLPQMMNKRVFDSHLAADGCRQILWGLFKKVVIADNCAFFVNQIYSQYQSESGSVLLLCAVLFAFQIYGDFSGYSDIAIGTSKLFGFKLMDNFRTPFFSRNASEIWRRWHISLNTWFMDYVYFPLGGSRVNKWKVVRNTFIVFGISGIWHGANWTFLFWGIYFALLITPSILLGTKVKYKNVVAEGRLLPTPKELFQVVSTFLLFVLGFILFRSETLVDAVQYYSIIFSSSLFSGKSISGCTSLWILIAVMVATEWVQREKPFTLDLSAVKSVWVRWLVYIVVFMMIICFGGHAENFIYFQF